MPLTPGLAPNIRLEQPQEGEEKVVHAGDVVVDIANDTEAQDEPVVGPGGKVLEIKHPDGSVTVSLDGQSLDEEEDEEPLGWFDNLVGKLDDNKLGRISEDLMRGIREDLESRTDWIEDRATGIRLLGLKIEAPSTGDSGDGAAVEGMSRIRHPLLLEACLRFQANARSEMLPTDGPVKIRDDSNTASLVQDQLAEAYQRDMNHYLTVTAKEYYPDTDRMLFMLGFGGITFKKVYYCPLRNRPVSETVDADDLIVNNSAIDLSGARRITHRVFMRPSTIKRLQILKVYKDIDLGTPMPAKLDAAQEAKKDQQGISADVKSPDDRDREIYECYCELDIQGYEHKIRGKVTGLEIPYRVTIDVSSKQILSIVRNYDKDTARLPEARQVFVPYTFVPGLGFYGIGLLHILGNTTNAVTAAWRELLDMGMFANFPGFLYAKGGGRQDTNIFRVPPGGGAQIDTQGMPINQAVMPMPYNMQNAPALMTLVDNITQTGARLGGVSEQAVGEGRPDAPVGTTLALIEQAQKILNSVHKRMHAAQAEEFQLIAKCFREHPESFWETNRKPARQWDEMVFRQAVENFDLVPQADPNTASHAQRVAKITALKQLQAASPTLYDPIAIDSAAIQALGFSNPQQFFAPPTAQAKPPPEMQAKQAELQIKKQDADARTLTAQTRAQEAQAKLGLGQAALQLQARTTDIDDKVKVAKAHLDASLKNKELVGKEDAQLMQERMQLIDVAQNLAVHPESAELVKPLIKPAFDDVVLRQRKSDASRGLGGAEPEV